MEPTRVYFSNSFGLPRLLPPDRLHNVKPNRGRQDAVCHVARIHRVLSLKRGNLMLVGVGGSGRQSLTRLAAYICGQELFTIEIAKNYRQVMYYM